MPEHLHFVTGRLAERSLRRAAAALSEEQGFSYSIGVMPITVAALMTPEWIAKRIAPPAGVDRVIVPGYCGGDLTIIERATGKPVERGPRDLRRLGELFGKRAAPADYGAYDIEIIAEINHCPGLSIKAIVHAARDLLRDGADRIDIGCEPGGGWTGVGDAVRVVRDLGCRVSIDSLDPAEIAAAVAAGADLVLSVNASNRDAAADWGCEVVAIPDDPKTLAGLDATVDQLAQHGVPLRIDPILEPIGFGFAESLCRYRDTRRRYPDAEMMMGIGNLTEMTEVDTAGVNTLLLAACQELGIRSVLTTQVISWAAGCVRECDRGRRLVHHAIENATPPKHLDSSLVMLRDGRLSEPTVGELEELAASVRDPNYRLFVAAGELHLVGPGIHLHDRDPFRICLALVDRAEQPGARPLDAGHAFYLGYELAKAATALALGKQYEQDEPLDWGLLTQREEGHYLQKRRRKATSGGDFHS